MAVTFKATLKAEGGMFFEAAKRRETREQRVAEAPGLLKRGRRTPLSSR